MENRTVLELGAGAGLPSLTAALHKARQVVVTDYPDAELIENLRHNISANISPSSTSSSSPSNGSYKRNITAQGYVWGGPIEPLTAHLSNAKTSLDGAAAGDEKPGTEEKAQKFDLLILADLLFNHSEHSKLLNTVQRTLKRSADAQALVFFTPYRPWLLEKDLAFFELARESGDFVVEKILEHEMEKVMFEEDRGDEKLRRTVFGYSLRWAEDKSERKQ